MTDSPIEAAAVFDAFSVSLDAPTPDAHRVLPRELLEDALSEMKLLFRTTDVNDWLTAHCGGARRDVSCPAFLELCAALRKNAPTEEDIRRAFRECDSAGLGFLDIPSLISILVYSGGAPDGAACDVAHDCDARGCGRVSENDIISHVRRTVPTPPPKADAGAAAAVSLLGKETEQRQSITAVEETERSRMATAVRLNAPRAAASPLPTAASPSPPPKVKPSGGRSCCC